VETAKCNADCTNAVCGDGYINSIAGEQCDDKGESWDCNANCTTPSCGDGVVNKTRNEECDDSGESKTCNTNCTKAKCATDSRTRRRRNNATRAATPFLRLRLHLVVCGDGHVNHPALEQCDDGALNGTPGHCN